MSKYVIKKDTSEVFLKSLSDGKWYFIGLTSKASSSTKVDSTLLKGGIGNGVIAKINTSKEIEIDVESVIHYDSISEIQNGTRFYNGGFVIPKTKTTTLVSGTFTLAGTDLPIGNSVVVEDVNGNQANGTFNPTNRQVTVNGLVDGTVEVYYSETEATTKILDITKDDFPENYEMWLHTISYNSKTNKILSDIYRHYYKTNPDGNEADTTEAGKNNGDTVKFTALVDDTTGKYGELVIVPRVATTLLSSPVLTADSTLNAVGNDIILTFTDDATWRGLITDVLINSVAVPISKIILASGTLTIDKSLFATAGTYNIVVVSNGYNTSSVNQTITA